MGASDSRTEQHQASQVRVFISYARKDHKDEGRAADSFVQKLYCALEEAGFDPWLDWHDMPSRGTAFPKELGQAIEAADRLIAVCGPNYPASDWSRAEREHARRMCIAITPVLADGDWKVCLPEDIRSLPGVKMADGFDGSWPELRKRLQQSVARPGLLRGDPIPLPPPGALQRPKLMAQIKEALRPDDSLPVVVSGREAISAVHAPAGLGKTTLAALAALDCEIRRGFPDGVVWIVVGRGTTAEELRLRIGAAFGLSAESMADPAALTALLGDKDCLIVFDDAWEHAPLAGCIVPGAKVRYLITTRKPGIAVSLNLPLGNRVALDYLTPDEGATLIAGRLGYGPGEACPHQDIHRQIAVTLGGHTGAIAIAAARLDPDRDGPDYAPRLLERLEDQENIFETLQVGEEREENLEKSLSLSYEDLSEDLRRRFRALGGFAKDGTFDEAAAAAVWGDDSPDKAHDALTELVGLALVERAGAGRHAVHNLTWAYALALLREAGDHDETCKRHFGYYVREHGDHDRNTPYAGRHAMIAADWGNITSALAWGLDHGPERACNLLNALESSYMQFWVPGTERTALLTCAHTAAVRSGYRLGEANCIQRLGDVHLSQSALPEAQARYEEALPIYRAIGDRLGEANTLMSIGDVLRRQERWAESLERYEQAIVLMKQMGNLYGEAIVRERMIVPLAALDRVEEAIRGGIFALEAYARLGVGRPEPVHRNLRGARERVGPERFDAAWRAVTGGDVPDGL